ncbi:MAG: PLxRFG domain-containing protein, partial [Solimonas sp.]
VDTLAQYLGYSWNTKEERNKVIAAAVAPVLGTGASDFVANGSSAVLPIDVQGRLGMQNLIPGTGLALKSQQDKSREIAEVHGPALALAQGVAEGAGKLLSGDVRGALRAAAPSAVRNALQAVDMMQNGFYRDSKGRRVIDTDGVDAAFKALGFQPASVARESKATQVLQQNIDLNRAIETEIADQWAQGIFDKDADKVQSAQERLQRWNRSNPESPIRIAPNQIQRRLKEMQMTRAQRFIKAAPKELRGQVAAAIDQ